MNIHRQISNTGHPSRKRAENSEFAGFSGLSRVSGLIAGVPFDDRLQGGIVLAGETAKIGVVAKLAGVGAWIGI
ncbi:hypothetical protein [Sinorhizobium meliloti]|uniref:hypothetical protein n=1 Tax=Rhizobium meliloti TaxID=382 RepID=UPI0013E2E6F7|nr:hypothetical protein [Sinorhizobium meliloti]